MATFTGSPFQGTLLGTNKADTFSGQVTGNAESATAYGAFNAQIDAGNGIDTITLMGKAGASGVGYGAYNSTLNGNNGNDIIKISGIGSSSDDIVYTIDLRNNVSSLPPSPFLSFVTPPEDFNHDGWLETVLKINLGPASSNPYDVAEFEVQYDGVPTGITVNIGDSSTNNGFGGDGATQSNDAELNIGGVIGSSNIYNDLFIWAHDGAPSPQLELIPDLVSQGSTVNLTVQDEFLAWNNNSGISGSLDSPYLYSLNGQADTEGPVNYDIFAAFNRVIAGNYRYGSGVGEATIRLRDLDSSLGIGVYQSSVGGDNGNDTLNISGTNFGIKDALISGGNGDDTFTVGTGQGTVDGGRGRDSLIIDYFQLDPSTQKPTNVIVSTNSGGDVLISGTTDNLGNHFDTFGQSNAWTQTIKGVELFAVNGTTYNASQFISKFG